MIVNELRTLPDRLVARLDPVRFQEYVRATGWVPECRLGQGKVGVYERPDAPLEQLSIPLTRNLADFGQLMASAVAYLALWEKRPALDVLSDLLLPAGDILRFAESGPATNRGSVPLLHVLDLLTGARTVLLAAACSVLHPTTFHPRLNLGEAGQFLERCQFGPTELSSYVVSVACPLDAGPNLTAGESVPFGRRVTSLLMRSVSRLAHLIELGAADAALQPVNGEPLLSANLCEGLLDLTPEGHGSALTISATWARHLPPGEGTLPARVRLPREAFDRLETLADRLRPEQVSRGRTWVGFVDTLNGRPNAANHIEGQVILRLLDPEHDMIRARVELNSDQYHVAWEAHGRNRPVILRGVLRRGGRLHRLDEVSDFAPLPREADDGKR
ncbi:MAG TPA: hypothetical protein VEL76_20750 [Gemmataceae bacterium]|nr:hypothetical protein [Gemmataceae bacterium]